MEGTVESELWEQKWNVDISPLALIFFEVTTFYMNFNKICSLIWYLFKHKLLNRIPAFCRRQAPHCEHNLVYETTVVFLLLCRCLRLTTNFAVSFLIVDGQFTRTQPCSLVTSYLQTHIFRSEYWISHNFWAPFYHKEEGRLSYIVSEL